MYLLAVDAAGNVLAVTSGGRLETFAPSGRLLSTLTLTAFEDIDSIAAGAAETLYVADRRGIWALDRATGTRRPAVSAARLRRASRSWAVASGPAGDIYAIHERRVQRFAADGTYLGSVGGDRRAHWIEGAITSDGSIVVPQFVPAQGGGAIVTFAPITSIDDTRPSVVVRSADRPPRAQRSRSRLLAEVRYTLSETADVRANLSWRTSEGRFEHFATRELGAKPRGSHTQRLDLKDFALTPPLRGDYRLTFVAQDDAGNVSRPAAVSLLASGR